MRIVSLLPAATEIVAAIGLESSLVGRSHECDFPSSVKSLPVCSRPRIRVDVAGEKIDRSVRSLLEKALSVYRVDAEKIKKLKPDVIVTQSQCEVCAVSPGDVQSALKTWVGGKPRILSLSPSTLEDVWREISEVGKVLGKAKESKKAAQALKKRVEKIYQKSRALPDKPRVACIEWIRPLMTAGNWVPTLVEKAGGINLFGEAGKHSPKLFFDALTQSDPDVILVMPCGFDIPKTKKEMKVLSAKDSWRNLRAVRTGKVYLADGHQYFNRPGPRLVESLEILAEIFHPSVFHFGHEKKGWERLLP